MMIDGWWIESKTLVDAVCTSKVQERAECSAPAQRLIVYMEHQ